MLAKFNSEVQTSMIGAADSSIMKLPDVSSIDNNILSSAGITTTTASVTTGANDAAMTTSSVIFKNKSIKPKMMRVYKG